MVESETGVAGGLRQVRFAGMRFTPLTVAETVAALAARDPAAPFAACVTPNAEFVYFNVRQREFATACAEAYVAANDSRILHRAARLAGLELKIAPGSDVTPRLFEEVIRPHDAITVVGSTPAMVEILRARFGLQRVAHHAPPMGFIHDEGAVRTAVDFVAAHPARFVFVAMGPPQSERFCRRVIEDGRATGLGLCIGSSLSLLSGASDPAPAWMQRHGMIWLHRLLREPARLWRRYLVHDMIALAICAGDVVALRLGRRRA